MWIYIIAIISGLCYASLLYLFNKKQHYGKTLTAILFSIRTIATTLLTLLLLNPLIKVKTENVENATLIIAQDNSSSLILTKDSSFYKKEYPIILNSFINQLSDSYTVDKYLFGNEVKELDSIDYKDHHTDFHQMLEYVKKNYYKKNVGALIILSDGICNKSYLPEQNIDAFPFPIHTVTLGDTNNYADIYIKDIFYNKTSPTNTEFPIRLVANANNCKGKKMEIKILSNNIIVEQINIPITSNHFSKTLDFNIDSGESETKQIDIEINTTENEIIKSNNSKRLFIEVIDKQHKALFLAKSPHPDLGSIKNILGDNFDIEMIFGEDSIPNLNKYDILFLHQIPYSGMSSYESLATKLNENKDIPIFYIIGESTDIEAFNDLQNSVQIKKGSVNSLLDIEPHYNTNFGLFRLDNEKVKIINTFPPLSLPHLDFSSDSNHDILLQIRINDIITQSPLLSFSTDNNGRKNAYLFGTGIWRWKLNDYYEQNNNNCFEELFSKSTKYLLTEKDKELIINHKEDYLSNEPITLTADLKNPSIELTNEPDLRIRITNKYSKDIYEYDFLRKDKSYYLSISNLPEDNYIFTADAEFGGKKYNERGSFSVVSVGAEAQDLVANSRRMQLLASLSGGKNYHVDELDLLTKDIENDDNITSILREEINYKDFINMKAIFFIILSLISIEWILRKMFS